MKDFHFVIDLAERDRTSAGGRIFVPQTNIFFSLLLWPWGRIYEPEYRSVLADEKKTAMGCDTSRNKKSSSQVWPFLSSRIVKGTS